MTIHRINHKNEIGFFDQNNAENGDVFKLTAKGAGAAIWGLSNTTIRFLGNQESATIGDAGPTTIYDEGKGTHLIFSFTADPDRDIIKIHDFQYDKTAYIQFMQTASFVGHLTPSSDDHGGTFLTGVGIKVDLVGDKHVLDSQHS